MQDTTTTQMRHHYTDGENTGLPAVPRLYDPDDETDPREAMEEDVWSHRLTETDR